MWLLLFYQIHTLQCSASHVKSMSIPMYFLQDGKIQQYLSYGTCIDIHTLPKIWVLIFLNHMVGTRIFAGVFGSIAKFTKTHVSLGKTSTLTSILSSTYGLFLSRRTPVPLNIAKRQFTHLFYQYAGFS